jgi:hypothetical protein
MEITRRGVGTLALSVALGSHVGAQQVQSSVSVVGGSATNVAGVTSRAVTITPSLSYAPDPRVTLGVDLSGTRYGDAGWSIGGSGSTAARLPLGRFAALAVRADAMATRTSYDFSYLVGNASPTIEVGTSAVRAYAGVRGTRAVTQLTRTSSMPGGLLGRATTSQSSVEVTRGGRFLIVGGSARVPAAEGGNVIIGAREERGTIDTTRSVDRNVSIAISQHRVTIAGLLGARDEGSTRQTFGAASASIAMNANVALEVGGGTYAGNRLLNTPAGRFLHLGVSLRSGARTSGMPRVKGVAAPLAGMTRLVLRDSRAQRVDVAGDFTNWNPIAAKRASDGLWYVDLRIPPGQYRYAFRVDGSTWKVPEGVAVSKDDFGGQSAWLTISGPPSV